MFESKASINSYSNLVECTYNKNHKMKKNNIFKHEEICPNRFNSSHNEAVSCPFNLYHRVLKSDLEKHKKVCENRPKVNNSDIKVENDIAEYLNKKENSNFINKKYDNKNLCNKQTQNISNKNSNNSKINLKIDNLLDTLNKEEDKGEDREYK